MQKLLLLPTLLATALLLAPTAYADDEEIFTRLMAQKADSIVSVKFVLTVKVTQGGQPVMAPQEQATNATGVIVDKSGLIMLPGNAFGAGGIPRQIRDRFQISAVPSNLRVVFPGDTKEYDAVLGAKDSKLGLAFVLIKDLGGKEIMPIDMATAVEPKVGQVLYAVSRLDQGFDFAPMVSRTKVAGRVTKPRDMWIIEGVGEENIGAPLYDAAGAMTGIVVTQEGVGEDSSMRPFLLPLKVATPTVANSLKKSKEELDRILEEAEEAAAEAEKAAAEGEKAGDKEGGDEPKKDGDEPKKDDDK
jgi:S1-C subfamily serine protease